MSEQLATEGRQTAAGIQRFTDVQVYVHTLLTLSVLTLLLTGLGITFEDHVWWVTWMFGYGNIVLIHIAAGVTMFASLLYYTIFGLTGLLTGDFPTDWLPGRDTGREFVAYWRSVFGRGEKPAAGKYTWIQKSEMLIIIAESIVLLTTGFLLTFPGLLIEYKPSFLAVRDIHAVVAFTLLMGVTYHLFDRHVEYYPLDRSMFTGRVTVDHAREEWARWANEKGVTDRLGDDAPAVSGGSDERHSGDANVPVSPRVLGALVLFMYAMIFSGVVLERVLAPLPTTNTAPLGSYQTETILEGTFGFVWTIGLNLAALVIVAAVVATFYGWYLRMKTSQEP